MVKSRIARLMDSRIAVLAGAVVAALAVVSAAADRIHVHGPIVQWSDDPTTTATIIWMERTFVDAREDRAWPAGRGWRPFDPRLISGSSPLRVRESGGGEWTAHEVSTRRFGDGIHPVRLVHLTGLAPDMTYEFILPDGLVEPPVVRSFRTAPAEPGDAPIVFVTGGDMYHNRKLLDAMNRRAGLEDPLFALLGGDLAYANNVDSQRWCEWFDSWAELAVAPDGRMVPMIVAIGNHETADPGAAPLAPGGSPPAATQFLSLFRLAGGRTHHAIDFGSYLSIVLLDSGEIQTVESQTAWLRAALEARADREHVFVCYHRPAFGTGVKNDVAAIRREWVPLFERYGVHAAFENDHHVYKRTALIDSSGMHPQGGVLYMGDGAWGVNVREIKDTSNRPWLERAEPINHLIRVELRADRRVYEAKTADGRVFDDFTQDRR